MKPPEAVSPRAFWGGVAVGIAFRTFAYSLLYGACLLQDVPELSPLMERVVDALYWAVALTVLPALFWVPFAAGFLSAYCWGYINAEDYARAIWLSVIGFFIVSIAVSLVARLNPVFCFLVPFIRLDVGMCDKGADKGNRFWNSRQCRQFLGDFSTDDWTSSDKNLS